MFCVQYHPEAAPGPHDSHYLFDDFVKLMSGRPLRMPRRNDLHRILIIGSGPIVIGQACEFDYSGTQACQSPARRRLRSGAGQFQSGHHHDRSRIWPIRPTSSRSRVPYLEEIIRRERPDALLSTVGGQTGLNLSVELAEAGVLEKYGVELIGAKIDAIKKAEDRLLFKDAMRKIGLRDAAIATCQQHRWPA